MRIHRRQQRKLQHVLKLSWGRKPAVELVLGHRAANAKEQVQTSKAISIDSRRLRIAGSTWSQCRRDHARVTGFKGRLLFRDFRLLKEILEQTFVDRGRSLELAKRNGRPVVGTGLTGDLLAPSALKTPHGPWPVHNRY